MVIAITNQKGGVGKTTTVLNVGVYLATFGKKVLLVDLDPQSNLTSGLGFDPKNEETNNSYDILINKIEAKDCIQNTRIENLDIIPSNIELAGAEIEMVNVLSRENILKKALEQIKNDYEYVLIDCPPSLGLLTINGLVAASNVLIPVQAEYFALEGLGQLINSITMIKENINQSLEVGGVVLTMHDNRTNLSKDVEYEIRQFFKEKMFKTVIPRNVRLSEAPSHGLSIYEYDRSSTGATAYNELTKEICERFGKSVGELKRPKLSKKS